MDRVGGEEGEGEMYRESNIEIYNTMCKKMPMGIRCVTRGTHTGALQQAEGWDGEGDGREVQEARDMGISMADSC